MTATVLDGKKIADGVRAEVRRGVEDFRARAGRVPGLDVVVVGEDPASLVYTRNKERAALEAGMRGRLHRMPASSTEGEVLARVERLNADDEVDGILVQLPLPSGLSEARLLEAVSPAKDVDGFHPLNAGRLAAGRPGLVPCTPAGCMRLLRASGRPLEGARAVVVGRSHIVGKPVAQLLLQQQATVTVAHSRTRDLPALCREADVLVVAVGRPEMVRGDWIKPGAVVIDVGINRVAALAEGEGGAKGSRLVGDVAFAEAVEVAGAITPVPGGVGPMTIACLLENTLIAANARVGRGGA